MLKFNNNFKIIFENKKKIKINKIINDIKIYGDDALMYYIEKIDGIKIKKVKDIILNKFILKKSYQKINHIKKKIIKEIYIRIKKFHNQNYLNSWQVNKKKIINGQKISSIKKICIYVPGGNTIYPSSIYMNAIPALLHKPDYISMVTPIKNGLISNFLTSIAYICNITELILSGGVHTLTCVVYGTNNIRKVNKISGPGNYFIAESKKMFFGNVGVDMIAGPSELVLICDSKIHPKIILYDFLSQLEHDNNAKSFIICNDLIYLKYLYINIYKIIKIINKKILFNSLNNSFMFFNNFYNASKITNFLSPEHLMLCIKNPLLIINFIENSGAIFIGYGTSVSYGDYCLGPSHVLPTNKTSRFFSALNPEFFVKKINIMKNNNFYCKFFSSYFSNLEKFLFHNKSSINRK